MWSAQTSLHLPPTTERHVREPDHLGALIGLTALAALFLGVLLAG